MSQYYGPIYSYQQSNKCESNTKRKHMYVQAEGWGPAQIHGTPHRKQR